MNCRLCDHDHLDEVIDLGNQYLSDFRNDGVLPPRYPLVALMCPKCSLVQLSETVSREEMYHERYGFKSGVSQSIRDDLRSIVMQAKEYRPAPRSWLDIASNDGTLLSFVQPDIIDQSDYHSHIYRVGVDPVKKYCLEAEAHADVIINDFFAADLIDGKFDVVTSISMFYDLDDPNGFVAQVAQVLAPDGIWVVQQNYLGKTLEYGAVDNFCHEHITYFTLATMENLLARHGLRVFYVETNDVNGGSIRTLICRDGVIKPDDTVYELQVEERRRGLVDSWPYKHFRRHVELQRNSLLAVVDAVGDEILYALGASTRGSTLIQYADIADRIVAVVERNPEKVGKVWGGLGIPIISESAARLNPPDWALITPWFFAAEIMERERGMMNWGTKMIVPLPKVEIVQGVRTP
jgi:SAM-dependent methyltransferase